jgi:glutamate/tyrosine decarboxylase-like PLP-dependent enzyme
MIQATPGFSKALANVRELYFSRNPDYWPAFRDPLFAGVIDWRKRHAPPDQRLAAFPGGRELLDALQVEDHMPEQAQPPGALTGRLVFAAALSKAWEDPASVENVISMPCDPAIHGAMTGLLANPNLVYREYCGMAEELELSVVRQIANLVGYDPNLATGIFTQGGTFCNLYGYLFGIRKSMPDSLHLGLEHGQDYRMINSQGGHYSNTTNLSLLGVNIAKKTIRVHLTDSSEIDMADLESQLTACFKLGCLVPTIMLTMGTTDTFAVDRVKPVHDLCAVLCKRHGVAVAPHIHVDAAVGWPLIFFLDYDFDRNPLEIHPHTLEGLRRNVDRFRELRYADSFTVDFQKWGYVPYTSSLVMVKDRASMKALEHDPENFSYFEKDVQGKTHLQSTIECSRGGAGLFGAYAAMQYLGKDGYRILIAHGLQNADYLRARLARAPGACVVATENRGPSVGFRLYDPATVSDPNEAFARDRALDDTPACRERLSRNNTYHREVFLRRGKVGLYTNWIQYVSHTHYDEGGRWEPLPGEKAVFMNPLTDPAHIDAFLGRLHG